MINTLGLTCFNSLYLTKFKPNKFKIKYEILI